MHRTQIMLEQAQYQELRERAQQAGKSMGQLARELIAAGLADHDAAGGAGSSLSELRGMFHAPAVTGRNHDDDLYGKR